MVLRHYVPGGRSRNTEKKSDEEAVSLTWDKVCEIAFGFLKIPPKDFYAMTWREFLLLQRGDWNRRKEQMEVVRLQTYILWSTAPRKKGKRLPKIEKFWPIGAEERRLSKAEIDNRKARSIALLEAKGYVKAKDRGTDSSRSGERAERSEKSDRSDKPVQSRSRSRRR